jgi:hypothetical protein
MQHIGQTMKCSSCRVQTMRLDRNSSIFKYMKASNLRWMKQEHQQFKMKHKTLTIFKFRGLGFHKMRQATTTSKSTNWKCKYTENTKPENSDLEFGSRWESEDEDMFLRRRIAFRSQREIEMLRWS